MNYEISLVFEDSYYSVDSKGKIVGTIGTSFMLEKGYSNSNVNVIFARKNSRLMKYVKPLADNKLTVIFPDLSIDNDKTWDIVIDLMREVMHNNNKNILIFPIPCIEFIFVKGFSDLAINNLQTIQNVLNRNCYTNDSLFINSRLPKKSLSFETFCKACIQNCFDISISKNRIRTKKEFYYSDKILEKDWRLITSLPVFANTKDNTFFKTTSADAPLLLKNELQVIENQLNVYKANGLINFDTGEYIDTFKEYTEFISLHKIF